MKKEKKSQAFSLDVVVVIALLLFGVLMVVLNNLESTSQKETEIQVETAQKEIDNTYEILEEKNIVENSNLDLDKLSEIKLSSN